MINSVQAAVPITAVGWRIWDFYAARDLYIETLTRGVLVNLDRNGVVAPENDRQVTASELDMILECFHDYALAIHLSTPADENRIPEFMNKLATRYPGLKERTFHIVPTLRPSTCAALIPVKQRHGYRVVLPHHTLYGADAWAPAVAVADQVVFDAARGQALNLDERTVDALRLIAEVSKAPIGLSGKLTPNSVPDLALPLAEVRALLGRPLALLGDSPLKSDSTLDLTRAQRFHDACARVLGIEVPPHVPVG